ncbi:MAG TPA: regulatory protein RecX [Candidatus Faecousia intestinigallinarum]|nr:regulatory protein RecX [Candidatus Faecousia intestinigallinarum]
MTLRIESLSASPDRAGRYYVKFSDGSTLRVYRQTVEDFALCTGREMTEEEAAALSKASGAMSAKMRAVRIVSASSVSKQDLQQRLVRKGEDPEQAAQAVAWMEELDLVDDARTAAQIVERCAAKGYGLARAKQALYEKRIPQRYWEEALADYPDQSEHIAAFLRARLDGESDRKEVKRAVDALLRKGHSYAQIQKCLRELSFAEECWE